MAPALHLLLAANALGRGVAFIGLSSTLLRSNPLKAQVPGGGTPSNPPTLATSSEETAKQSVVFMRHGESTFNKLDVFTGWCDVPLTEVGRREAREAGYVLASHSMEFDVVFTSVLQRCTTTAYTTLEACGQTYVDVRPRWELNERHYGALQGLSKSELAKTTPADVLHAWRKSYCARPPPMTDAHPHWRLISEDRRYKHLSIGAENSTVMDEYESPHHLPRAESLADTAVRVVDLWEREIAPLVREGKRVLVVAHRNSLRALIRNLEGLDDAAVAAMTIPTARPFLYPLEEEEPGPAAPPNSDELKIPRQWRRLVRSRADDELDSEIVAEFDCGFQGIFLNDQGKEMVREQQERCIQKWKENPESPPDECLVDYSAKGFDSLPLSAPPT
mmetsp:Transcript_87911/g.175854  ORF Transcript_87911/g.175854 Transcript_87911/m.175854 type:complete len:390 (+) Transcript_87911:124-1293(+)|eukprot:CAMPEP_0171738910 /NCGR_PEP_ID=MMETSP0991-20121206/33900_1 /TAXON_ID=483369 /ORGANISM="non described non described, Strain CCMP2098" /LENGTH=389 /DNA_ID=CAMNT_0012336389 /DNA_START=35 /DNA_END=1204 /DNA_ORIENTATION=+